MVGAAMVASAMSAYAVAPEVGKSYSIKFLSNGNYLSDVNGSFKCQEGIGANSLWTIEAATSGEGYYLYNPTNEVYVYRFGGWTMSTTAEPTESSNFDFVAVDGMEDTYVLAMLDNGKYVASDNPLQANCSVYGDKSWDKALANGLVQFEEWSFDSYDAESVYNYAKQAAETYLSELENDSELAAFVKKSAEYQGVARCLAETPESWESANSELNGAMSELKNAVPVYKNYLAALKYGNELKASAVYATQDAVYDLDEALSEVLNDGFEAMDVQDLINWVYWACRGVVETNAVLANLEGAANYTDRIVNPGAGTNDGWNLGDVDSSLCDFEPLEYDCNTTSEPIMLSGDNMIGTYWNLWNNDPWGNDFYQIVTLPAGTYRLSVFARSSADSFNKFALYAGAESVDIEQAGNKGNIFGSGWNNYYLDFTLAEESPVQLGIIAATNNRGSWASFTGFQLVRFPGEGEAPGENPGEEPGEEPEEEATLRVKNGDMHEMVLYCAQGSSVKILPVAEEGWMLHSVILNDEDITDSAEGNGNMLIVEDLRGHNTLNFVYANVGPTVEVCEAIANQLHVVVYDDNIKISGKAEGDVVEVFDVNGIALYSGIESVIKLPAAQGVVLIKVGGQTYKGYIR